MLCYLAITMQACSTEFLVCFIKPGLPNCVGGFEQYCAETGRDPCTTLPVLLDIGTDDAERHSMKSYQCAKHPRLPGAALHEVRLIMSSPPAYTA